MFDIPGSDIVGVRVDEETVKISKTPEYIRARHSSHNDDLVDQSVETNDLKTKDNNSNKISLPTC